MEQICAEYDWESETGQKQAINSLIHDINIPEKRAFAMQELCKVKDRPQLADALAPALWYSFGTMASLLQEIISIYPALTASKLSKARTARVCNAMSLYQIVAQNNETRQLFFESRIFIYLYPFFQTSFKLRVFEYMRMTSLGVIGALLKMENSQVINFLLQTELIPLCLRVMEQAKDLSRTLALFILQKILMDDNGLHYIYSHGKRFYHVASLLSSLVDDIQSKASAFTDRFSDQKQQLLEYIFKSLLRLSENKSMLKHLQKCLPQALLDGSLTLIVKDNPNLMSMLRRLIAIMQMDVDANNTPPTPTTEN